MSQTTEPLLPSEHIKNILVTNGFRWNQQPAQAWDTWIGKMPSSPDAAVTIYDSGGLASWPHMLLDFPSVQIKVRGGETEYKEAFLKARAVREMVLGIPSYDATNGDRIVSITAIGDVAFTGWDDKKRPEFVFNMRMIIEPNGDNFETSNREPL